MLILCFTSRLVLLISTVPAALSRALPIPVPPWFCATPSPSLSHPSGHIHPTPPAIWDGESGRSAGSRDGMVVLGKGLPQCGEKIANKKHLIDFWVIFFLTNGRGALGSRRLLWPVSSLCAAAS